MILRSSMGQHPQVAVLQSMSSKYILMSKWYLILITDNLPVPVQDVACVQQDNSKITDNCYCSVQPISLCGGIGMKQRVPVNIQSL